MNLWTLEIQAGTFILDFAFMGALLYAGMLIHKYVGFIRQNLVPVNVMAGTIGLTLVWTGFNGGFLDSERLGTYVYHLLALLFIAFGLRSPVSGSGSTSVKFGLVFIITYLVQAIVGLLLTFLLIYTLFPDLFAGLGLLMPLAFGMNPGIAFSIGQSWEPYGFSDGGTVGLTFAAIGFAVAYGVGIFMVKRGIEKGQASYVASGLADVDEEANNAELTAIYTAKNEPFTEANDSARSDTIESLSLHLAVIGSTYVLTWLVLSGISKLLEITGAGHEIPTLWSFHFIIAAVLALAVRKALDHSGQSSWFEDATFTRTGNLFMDFMVVASIAAITLAVVSAYWVPLLLLGSVTAVSTWFVVRKATKDLFDSYQLERSMSIFGNMTGTMQSALVLLRLLDPRFTSTVSSELVYGSGLALALGFPLLILINAPINYFDDLLIGFWYVLGAIVIYLMILLVFWKILRTKRAD